ncbi:hypothetical protein FDP41_002223 [Naegleria fowleri]|uniref:Zn(2)-C6 fungal-type domain-containing protein n=1 Tax=Naegleria fowleri TaxID=5763 RepID=A0A6A5BK89_NAEFO|nr:uncharacterized protein FDP41_002223 [Naegleria fowleri]KAF0978403.1 hypothetical protein FDP41_002223 [Naegleria fowleri]
MSSSHPQFGLHSHLPSSSSPTGNSSGSSSGGHQKVGVGLANLMTNGLNAFNVVGSGSSGNGVGIPLLSSSPSSLNHLSTTPTTTSSSSQLHQFRSGATLSNNTTVNSLNGGSGLNNLISSSSSQLSVDHHHQLRNLSGNHLIGSLTNNNNNGSNALSSPSLLSFNNVHGQIPPPSTSSAASSLTGSLAGKLNTIISSKGSISHLELPINEFSSSAPVHNDLLDNPLTNHLPLPIMNNNNSQNNHDEDTAGSFDPQPVDTKNNNNNGKTNPSLQKELSGVTKRPRRVAKLACVSCRKAHACCEDKRPCSRCIAHGLECQDQVGKKRGRKKKSGSDTEEQLQNKEADENNTENSTAAGEPSQHTAHASTSEDKKKKKRGKSSKKTKGEIKKEEGINEQQQNQQQPSSSSSSFNQKQTSNNQFIQSSSNSSTALQVTDSELKTPGAMLASGNSVIFPNGDNHGLSVPLLMNQPPEIQQLTQILMRTPVDTFFLHCNNLNTAYDYQNNQSLFGTPYSLHLDDNSIANYNNNNNINNNNSKSNLTPNQLVSPGGATSPFIDFTSDDFLRFSPQSPLFASLVEMNDIEVNNEVQQVSSDTTTLLNDVNKETNFGSNALSSLSSENQFSKSNVASATMENPNVGTSTAGSSSDDGVQIEDYPNEDTTKTSHQSPKEDDMFERLKKMSNEELIKCLQIGEDTKKMIEDSISHLKAFDSNPETASMTYIEYLTQNFPISLLLKHKLSESAKRLMAGCEPTSVSSEKEIEILKEENKRLKEENLRKANESAMLSAINENLRNRFSELASKGIIKMQYDEPPTYGANNKPTAIQNSYQELVMLMENKQEMDSSDFGIMIMFPGGRLVSLNKTLLTKLNYDPADLYDNLERWEDVVHPESYPQIIAHVSRVLKTPPAPRKSFKCKVLCRKKGGGTVSAELYLCIVGGKFSYIPVFAIGYFLFDDSKPIQ